MARIFSKGTLRSYWESHPETEIYLRAWHDTVNKADWKNPKDVQATYAHASILKNNRVIFNIKGNAYRLIAEINYEKQWVFIRFIGTHSEYDKINPYNV